jgi:rubrerythrin
MLVSDIIFLYLIVMLVGWVVVAFYARRQVVEFDHATSYDHVFSCEWCGYVYTDDGDVDRSLCPECGKMNNSVQF